VEAKLGKKHDLYRLAYYTLEAYSKLAELSREAFQAASKSSGPCF